MTMTSSSSELWVRDGETMYWVSQRGRVVSPSGRPCAVVKMPPGDPLGRWGFWALGRWRPIEPLIQAAFGIETEEPWEPVDDGPEEDRRAPRAVVDSWTGERYPSQVAAARSVGITQATVHRHLTLQVTRPRFYYD